MKAYQWRGKLQLTQYSRIGHSPSVRHEVRSGIGEAFQFRGSGISRTHPHRLTAQAQPAPDGALSRWDVVNTITLGEIAETHTNQ